MRLVLFCAVLAGCAPFTAARPLEPGQHEVGFSLGGPLVNAFGAPIPLPMVLAQGRSGVAMLGERPLDVSYGLNVTGIAFGVIGVYGGASYLFVDQSGGVPAVTLTDRLFFSTNPIDPGSAQYSRGVSLVNQLEVSVSWLLGNHLLYVSLSEHLDLVNPGLLLTPQLGLVVDPGEREGMKLHIQTHYWAMNYRPNTDRVAWVSPGTGAFGANLGLSWTFGGGQ